MRPILNKQMCYYWQQQTAWEFHLYLRGGNTFQGPFTGFGKGLESSIQTLVEVTPSNDPIKGIGKGISRMYIGTNSTRFNKHQNPRTRDQEDYSKFSLVKRRQKSILQDYFREGQASNLRSKDDYSGIILTKVLYFIIFSIFMFIKDFIVSLYSKIKCIE